MTCTLHAVIRSTGCPFSRSVSDGPLALCVAPFEIFSLLENPAGVSKGFSHRLRFHSGEIPDGLDKESRRITLVDASQALYKNLPALIVYNARYSRSAGFRMPLTGGDIVRKAEVAVSYLFLIKRSSRWLPR